MSNLDILRDRYADHFTGNAARYNLPTACMDREAFIVTSADTMQQDTIGDSNVTTVSEHLGADIIDRAYTSEAVVWVDDMEDDDDLAGEVLEVMEALEDYPVFDDTHYCNLEYGRLQEYAADILPGEIAYELEVDPRDDTEIDKITEWVSDNYHVVMEHADGSVDDVPFNAKALAELYKG